MERADSERKNRPARACRCRSLASGVLTVGSSLIRVRRGTASGLKKLTKQRRLILVCTENSNPDVMVMKPAEYRV